MAGHTIDCFNADHVQATLGSPVLRSCGTPRRLGMGVVSESLLDRDLDQSSNSSVFAQCPLW